LPLKTAAMPEDVAEAVVGFSFELRRRAVEAYLRAGLRNPAEAVPHLRRNVGAVMGRLFEAADVLQGIPPAVVGEYLYDEAVYVHYYLRRYGLIAPGRRVSHGANL